ncbi:MAG: DsbA family oxidoreductase, partial [Vallitaleaceae bacterium]|nr:DsbA family oxidoreductase [Vallitaleaceae bacterium]
KDEVEITFRSFQLDPNAKRHPDQDIHQLIANKYGMSYESAKANNDRIVAAAAEVGLAYRFDLLKPNQTATAHQLAQYAKEMGKEKEVVLRFFQGYFEEGIDIGDQDILLELVEEAGLNKKDAQEALEKKRFIEKVAQDQRDAEKIWIDVVPYFISGKERISGAQSVEEFLEFLRKAY